MKNGSQVQNQYVKGYHFSIEVYKRVPFLLEIKGKGWTFRVGIVSFAAVIRIVTQRSSPLVGGALRDDPNNG